MRTVKERWRTIPNNPVFKNGSKYALAGYLRYKGKEFTRRYSLLNPAAKAKMAYEILSVLGYVPGTEKKIPREHELTDRYDEADVKYVMGPGNWEYYMGAALASKDKGVLCNNQDGCSYKPENSNQVDYCAYGEQCDLDGLVDAYGDIWKVGDYGPTVQTDSMGRPVDAEGFEKKGIKLPLDKQWGALKRNDLRSRADWWPLWEKRDTIRRYLKNKYDFR